MGRKKKSAISMKKKREEQNRLFLKITSKVGKGQLLKDAITSEAKSAGVAYATMRSRYHRARTRAKTFSEKSEKNHGSSLMTVEEEKAFVDVCKCFAMLGEGLTRKQLLAFVREYKGLSSPHGGKKFVDRLLRDHSEELKQIKTKDLTRSRYKIGHLDSIERYITLMEQGGDAKRYGPHQVLNCDEFLCSVPLGSSNLQRIQLRRQNKSGKRRSARGNVPSILPVVSAAGTVLLVFIIIPSKEIGGRRVVEDISLKYRRYLKRTDLRIFYVLSDSGRMDKEIWPLFAEKVIEIWNLRNPGLEAKLQMDGLDYHKSLDVCLKLRENNIRCVWPPGGSTCYHQPLDDVVFGTLKNRLVVEVENSFNFQLDKYTPMATKIASVLPELMQKVFSKRLIKASFANTGVYPFNPELIRKNAKNFAREEIEDFDINERLAEVVKTVVTPKSNKKRRTYTVSAHSKRLAMTPEQLIENAGKRRELADAKSKEKKRRRMNSAVNSEERYEKFVNIGKELLAKKKEKGDKNYEDDEWLKKNTCNICRQKHKGALNWEWPKCRAFKVCKRCLGFGRYTIEAHENFCDDCKKVPEI